MTEPAATDPVVEIPPELLPKIPALKRQHGDLFLSKLGDMLFVYRALTLGEFLDYQDLSTKDSLEAEESVLKAIVYPGLVNTDQLGAGAVATLIQQVLKNSNFESFDSLEAALGKERVFAQTAEGIMVAYICAAFPGYKIDDVYNLPQAKLVRCLALAEVILQRPIEFARTDKKQKRKRGFGMMAPPTNPPPGSINLEEENRGMGYGR